MNNLLVFICSSLLSLLLLSNVIGSETDEKAEQPTEKVKETNKERKIYTWIDKYGNRIYSDEPKEGAEVMKLNKGSSYKPPEPVEPDWSSMRPKVISTGDLYSHFTIASPADNATIRSNEGVFQVALDIRPKLAKFHRIKLEVDGAAVSGSGSIITVKNIDQGTHSLIAYIISADKKVIATTKAVTIHLHKARQGGN